jgi:hypothetical protein
MKKILVILVALLGSMSMLKAQDIIVKRNGDEIKAIVLKVSSTEVEYKKFGSSSNVIYTLLKSEIFMIKYADGDKDVFKEEAAPAAAAPAAAAPAPGKSVQPAPASAKLDVKPFDFNKKRFGFDWGIGKMKGGEGMTTDFGIHYTHNYNKYAGWNIFDVRAQFFRAEDADGKVATSIGAIQGMMGFRMTIPVLSNDAQVLLAPFFAFKIGYGYMPDLSAGGLCYELEIGIEAFSSVYMDFVVNHQGGSYDYSVTSGSGRYARTVSGTVDIDASFLGFRLGYQF